MPGVPSLQPQWCEECGQPEMAWVVSATDINKEQNADKDVESQTGSADVLIGNEIETSTKEEKSETLAKSEGGIEPYYLCTDPTCEGYLNTFSDIIWWKMTNVSEYEYSDDEVMEITEKAAERAIRDYQTVTETVEEMAEGKVPQNPEVEETPPQQLGRCGCGEQQKPVQRSVGKTETEQESVTNTTRMMRSLKASASGIPLINVEVGARHKVVRKRRTQRCRHSIRLIRDSFQSVRTAAVKSISRRWG